MLSLPRCPCPPRRSTSTHQRQPQPRRDQVQALHCEGMHRGLGTGRPWGTWAQGMRPSTLGPLTEGLGAKQ